MGILTINALTCANTVVVPVSPDGYSLQGFHQLTESIRTIKRYSNPQLKTGGILITRYVPNTNVSKAIREIASDYAAMAKTKVYKAVIRQTVSVNESISAQEGLMLFAPNSTAAQDYRAFASEIKRDELLKGGELNGKETELFDVIGAEECTPFLTVLESARRRCKRFSRRI